MELLKNLPKPFFVLAPMDDVTDTVFRRIVASCAAPDLYFTEFVNVDGLQSAGRERLLAKLRFSPAEQPLIAQLWGLTPEHFYKTAAELVELGFAGIDLNMGCPVKAVVKTGACVALMNDRELAVEIIQATQAGAAGKIPVSVKTRLGFNQIDYSWHELLLKQNLQMLTIHGRTKKDMSSTPADWEAIAHVRELRDELAPGTLIIGNGDVMTRQQGIDLANQHKLDGIMIGRGVFQDPFVFAQSSPWETWTKEQKINLYAKHVKLFTETWQHHERLVHSLNKFCKIYINGFDGAKDLRERLMQVQTADELLELLNAQS